MLILHAGYSDSNFFVWGERSFGPDDLVPACESGTPPPRMPWDAGARAVHEILRAAGIRRGRKTPAVPRIEAFVELPIRQGLPIPSSPLLGEVPVSTGPVSLKRYGVEALPLVFDELVMFSKMIREGREKLPVPGLLYGNDLKYVVRALEYASIMVMRGACLPGIEPAGEGYCSSWRPLHLVKYLEEYAALINALPPVMKSFSLKAEEKHTGENVSAADLMLEFLIDEIVRRAQAAPGRRGRQVDHANPHDIWLRSLAWSKSPLDRWKDEMGQLSSSIESWTNSVRTVTNQPWRLFMRLEEPLGNMTEDPWRLSWHLRYVMDQSLTVPAEKVWSPGPAERKLFRLSGTNPRRYMLHTLGQIASIIPAVARSLEVARPMGCDMLFEELPSFLHDSVPAILDQGVEIQFPAGFGPELTGTRLAVKGKIRGESQNVFDSGIGIGNLFDVDWAVSLDGEDLTEGELSMLRELKAPLVNIRGKWILLRRDDIAKLLDGMKKLPKKITGRDALLSSFRESRGDMPIVAMEGSSWLDSMTSVLTGKSEVDQIGQPHGFRGELRPYQLKGLSWLFWLLGKGLGGCLADDMGLGKTVQTLALLKARSLSGEQKPALLICPTSVIENWRRESAAFVPDMQVAVYHGNKRPKGEKFPGYVKGKDLIISSYSILHRDRETFGSIGWSGVILDEAQNIKNPETRQARAARSMQADWRLALTGTPVENHVGDMWSIMEFLMPGLLPNRSRFERDFMRPIQAGDGEAVSRIRNITAPFILRRLKSDKNIISDLPDKIESDVFCPLSREQASLYGAVLDNLEEDLAATEGIKRKGAVLAAITSLKQICNHPALYLKDRSSLGRRSGKLSRLTDIAEEMLSVGDRALIFTQYAEMGAMLKSYLQETFGREALFLHGGTERRKRDEMVMRFQESKDAPPFFVLSLKAGGTGLNLTRANHVVLFDRWWNPAVEQQAVDRAHRIGQKESVQVHYFCCRGTLEERIEHVIRAKKDMADAIVSSGEGWITEMSDKEIKKIFKLSRDAVEDLD